MSFRNERFNRSCLSLDKFAESIAPAKSRIVSDRGAGAERIFRAVDHEDEQEAEREIELENRCFVMLLLAEWLLDLCGKDRLIPVLEQVVMNGSNRKESISWLSMTWHVKKHVARVMYHQGVRDLLTFFSPNKIKGETQV